MTTSHRRILQKIDTPKTHVQNVIHLYHEKKKKLSKNKTITKNNNKNIIAVGTVLKDNQQILETSKLDTSHPCPLFDIGTWIKSD